MRFETSLFALIVVLGCSSTADEPPGGTGGAGGAGATGGSAGSSAGSGGVGGSGAAGGSAGSAGSSAGAGGSAGSSGSGGSGGAWPTCDAPPAGAPQKSIAEVWTDDPAQPTPTWLGGVYVTGISGSACTATAACQLFVQAAETFASFAAGAHQAIRVLVFPPAVTDFVPLVVGDQIDLYGPVWRHTAGGQNELFVEISSSYPGCAKKIGSGSPTGIPGVTLDDLTLAAYETTHGPLLVTLTSVSGKVKLPNETFALFKSFQIEDGGIANVTSLSPYFLPNNAFVGWTEGNLINFSSLTGVFGLFVPSGSTTKYEEIYIRSMSDAVVGGT